MNLMKEKVMLFWSGGKNSALALYYLKQNPNYEVIGLITTFDRETNLVPFHGIPDSLILEQAKMLKLPLQRLFLPTNPTNEEYSNIVCELLHKFKKIGVRNIAFGDSLLEDVKKFREELLAPLEIKALFPLWNKSALEITNDFFQTNHKALVTSILTSKLQSQFLACEFNQFYVDQLPSNVDPAGTLGEYHTFVNYGPDFKMRVAFSKSIAHNEGPYLVSSVKEP